MTAPGQAIGHYRIIERLGAGGMGEVWRARDTRLEREVAIKLLPAAWAGDGLLLRQLEREARLLAGLSHGNIATIYGLEHGAFVMELIEGQTLAARMAHGPIPVREALNLALQIAAGLEYAHQKGIIHRDLKPGNIMITAQGVVRILDFGLAYAATPGTGAEAAEAPTVSLPGAILGTPAYMSPEQARGEILDVRTDIWAFGVIVYEMLTGRALFAAPTHAETLAAVLQREPDLTLLPPGVGPVVERCLKKSASERWGWIGDVRVLLEAGGMAAPAAPKASAGVWKWAVAALAVAALAGPWLAWRLRPLPLAPSPEVSLNLGAGVVDGEVAVTPDGKSLVYPVATPGGGTQLVIRRLDQPQPQVITGSEGASGPLFFSPDGTQVGFWKDAGEIAALPLAGGAPATICPAGYFSGASWDGQGDLILAQNFSGGALRLAPAGGGAPQPWLHLAGRDVEQFQPQVLPGGKAVLFIASPSVNDLDQAEVEAARLPGLAVTHVLAPARWARYLPGAAAANRGYLLYLRGTALYAVGFNLDSLATHGPAVLLLDHIRANRDYPEQAALSLSPDGTLVYETGAAPEAQWNLNWLDPSGATHPLLATPGTYRRPQFSPDGSHLVFENGSTDAPDLWVYDLRRGTAMRIAAGTEPVWAPDGQHLAFAGVGAQTGIYWVRSDGALPPRRLLAAPAVPWSFSPDGARLAYMLQPPGAPISSWLLPLQHGDSDAPVAGAPQPLLNGIAPAISPDGRWVAYSRLSGDHAPDVRPLAGPSARWQISSGKASWITWSRRSPKLYYETEDGHLMVVPYSLRGGLFQPGQPAAWSPVALLNHKPGGSNYAPDPAADRMAVLGPPRTPPLPVVANVILNVAGKIERALASHR
ncbi:MAG: protein kinase domain-containing protein [Terriglobales bacterium]